MYIAVNMADIVFSATVNILGNEFKYSFLYKIYYDIYLYNLYVCVCVILTTDEGDDAVVPLLPSLPRYGGTGMIYQ